MTDQTPIGLQSARGEKSMQGALKITYLDGNVEYFEVEPVGGQADMATRLKSFLASPNVSLFCGDELIVIPSTSIRSLSITRTGNLPEAELAAMPGVIMGARRVLG
jgi:hypothetical protein